ncbi:MAG: ATP synthase F1 subunit delta [Spirochaetes bacterium]|nr:ATP synthase F1 subunit delta [Spirochaetota bacterium]
MAVNEIAKVYAASLIEIGQKQNILPQIEEEMKFISELFQENHDMKNFIVSPGFSREAKKNFIDKVFGNNLSEIVNSTLKILVDSDRQTVIPDLYQAMIEMIDVVNNRQWVTVVTCEKLDDSIREKIAGELKSKFKKEIKIKEEIDNGILGGIIIKIGDLVIDGSLIKDLKNIRKNLLNRKIRSEAAYED